MMTLKMKGTRTIPVATFEDAAVEYAAAGYVGRGSAFYSRGVGAIMDASGAVVAHVSPNGRVWKDSPSLTSRTMLCESAYTGGAR